MEIAKERKRENCRFHEAQDRHNGLAGEYIISTYRPFLSRLVPFFFLYLASYMSLGPSAIFICVEYINAPRDM